MITYFSPSLLCCFKLTLFSKSCSDNSGLILDQKVESREISAESMKEYKETAKIWLSQEYRAVKFSNTPWMGFWAFSESNFNYTECVLTLNA